MADVTYSQTAIKILSTAKRLFMQRGYRAVSINDIVQAAEITKPTLYYHFADKDELFTQMALHTLAEMHQRMDAAIEGIHETAGRLVALAEVAMNASDGDTRMMRHQIREHLGPAQQARIAVAFQQQMVEPLRQVMEEGVARGELSRRDPGELAWLYLSFIEGFHREPEPALESEYGSPIVVAHFPIPALIDLFLHGVAPRDQS
jgi:AcrR family transcriptional regulator